MGRPNNTKPSSGCVHHFMTGLGIILCVILIPILILNLTLLFKSVTTDDVPSVGGHLPMIVLTDSMYPEIRSGDLIICKTAEPEQVEVGDVISFFDPAGNGITVVTHRVTEILKDGEDLQWITQGDNNNAPDSVPVPAENLVGIYTDIRIPGAGNAAMFLQTTQGLIICVVVPLLLLIAYDVIRRRLYERRRRDDADALRQELEELRAFKAQKDGSDKTLSDK